MKDKNLAAVLAFFGGAIGLHRFYLGQVGLGILYCIIFPIAALISLIDAIAFLTMDQEVFDAKYNKEQYRTRRGSPGAPITSRNPAGRSAAPLNDRERRHQERQRKRAARQTERATSRPAERRRASRQNPTDDPGRAERQAGMRYFRDFEYDRAVIAFERALKKNPTDVASHFNIACSYSCEEEADRAFYHLDRAVALGFDDFERIREHDSLAFVRVQPRYVDFAANGFRLVADRTADEKELANPIKEELPAEAPEPNEDLLDQLQRLATLREKGLLTDTEFATQKKRLLG